MTYVGFCLIGLACVLAVAGTAEAKPLPAPEVPVISFDKPDALQGVLRHQTELSIVDRPGGGKALQVHFDKAPWPNVFFDASGHPWDWSKSAGLAVDVTNPGGKPVDVCLRVDNSGADGVRNCNTGRGSVEPGKTETLTVEFNAGVDLGLWGMRGFPPINKHPGPTIDPKQIVAFQVFLPRPKEPETLILDNIRLFGKGKPVEPPKTKAFGDRFGQYAWADWPGKLKAEDEFKQRRADEERDLTDHPAVPDRDRYGGWASGPRLKATGWFRTEKVGGKWWLVDPDGRLFFSDGMDCVRPADSTIVEQRKDWFEWLPDPAGELGKYYGKIGFVHTGPVTKGATLDFFSINLQRKYGPDWQKPWRQVTLQRLRSWGFNTIANWSDKNIFLDSDMPYVATVNIGGTHRRISSGSDYWGKMHDVYDPQFAQDTATAVRSQAPLWQGKPFCLGIFVDNELSWGRPEGFGLAVGALDSPPDQPAKLAFLADLRKQYGTIDKLNAAWNTKWPSWEEMDRHPAAPSGDLTTACQHDLHEFIYRFSQKYFTTVRDAIRATDANHLYLGCRFASGNPDSYRAAAEVCDVVSFNIYRPRLDPKQWAFTTDLGKPCIIGEFHFGALDRGMFHPGLVRAEDQADRARMYIDYVKSVADMPAFVGCHWFEYVDEPLTGRVLDGENYNIGFVNVVDQPYPEMVAAVRHVHGEIYADRDHAAAAPAQADGGKRD